MEQPKTVSKCNFLFSDLTWGKNNQKMNDSSHWSPSHMFWHGLKLRVMSVTQTAEGLFNKILIHYFIVIGSDTPNSKAV